MRELWVQEKVRRGELSIIKVRGEDNVLGFGFGLGSNLDLDWIQSYGDLPVGLKALCFGPARIPEGSGPRGLLDGAVPIEPRIPLQ